MRIDVYRKAELPGGKRMKLERAMALTEVVQADLDARIIAAEARAQSRLGAAKGRGGAGRPSGGSKVYRERGHIDRWLTLDDSSDLGAAMTIEFGRAPHVDADGNAVGGHAGLYILTDAIGRPRPRRSRKPRRRQTRKKG